MHQLKVRQAMLLLATLTIATSRAVASDPVEADWLYLTGNGSWIARTTTLRQAETALPLPVERLSANTFWWSSDEPNLSVFWRSPETFSWVSEGSLVQVADWPGSWTVVKDTGELLILSQPGARRALPRGDWGRLSWIVGQNHEESLSLRVSQPGEKSTGLAYAWLDNRVTAEVRYSLDYRTSVPVLMQQLVVHNDADYELTGEGYSFAQSSEQPVGMMARSTMAVAAESAELGRPQPGDSSGRATLRSDSRIRMPANSHAWLPVASVELSGIEHEYGFNWSTRQQGSMAGQWSMTIVGKESLPDIAGPVQIAVWDQQVALLETRYRPEQEDRATLSFGVSDMVTLATNTLSGREWELVITNRNSHSIEARLQLNHWGNNREVRTDFTTPVSANDTARLRVRLDGDELSARPL